MKQLHFIPIVLLTTALIGGPGIPSLISSVGTVDAAGMLEEVPLKGRGGAPRQSAVSKPGIERKSNQQMGIIIEDKQGKSMRHAPRNKKRQGMGIEESQKKRQRSVPR